MKILNCFRLFSLIAGLLICCNPLTAGHYYFKQLSMKDGLPSTVRCIYAEKKGFVWIGTKAGLGRFDGYELKRYMHHPDHPNSLPHNHIHQIVEDSLHNVWIMTDKGIARYRRRSDDFDIIKNKNNQNIIVNASCRTSQGMLFGARNKIYFYRYKDDSFTLLRDFVTDTPFSVSYIGMWDAETLLCASRWQGVLLLNLRTGEVTSPPFDCGKEIMVIMIDSRKRIWVAPYNNGIRCFAKDGTLLSSYTTANSRLNNDVVLSMAEKDEHIWIGTDGGGINVLDPETKDFTILEHIPGDAYSLPVNSISCLHNDANHNMWAGSIRSGLINIREISMKTYTDAMPGNDGGLSDNTVLSLYQDSASGDIWIGTDGGGLNRLNPETERFRHYPATWKSKVASVTGFTPCELLLSIFSKGLFVFNKSTGSVRPLHIDNDELNNLIRYSGRTLNVCQTVPGSVYLLGDHIYRYDIASGSVEAIDQEQDEECVGSILPVCHEPQTSYFCDLHRIYALDRAANKLHSVFKCGRDTVMNSVSRDENGVFWIGNNKGLSYYNPKNGEYKHLPTSLFEEVNSIICDRKGKIWIGTDQMLFAWLVNEKRFVLFGESDGVLINEYLPKPRLLYTGGDIYMGGIKGLLRIDRNLPVESSEYPQMQLTDVLINGESVSDALGSGSAGISVPWSSKSIAVRVMSCEKDIFRQKIYRYQIVGLNNQYIDSYSPELVIRSLLPGNYRIMAACSTKDGNWTALQQVLSLTILPPWYKTWWFIVGCILMVAGVIIQIFLVALRRKENKLKWAMKEHEKLMFEEKVRFLINISHELRTPLTLIHAPLNRILKSLSDEDSNYVALKGIYRQSQRMRDLLNMVLDLRKMEVGVSKLSIHPHRLNEWVVEVSADFVSECEARGVEIRYRLDERIAEVSFDKDKCEIILTNLLINALKHSPEGTDIVICTELLPDVKRVRVSVSDQGCGLKQVDINKLFTRFYQGGGERNGTGIGLSYSKILAELHGGLIGARDNDTVGAVFFFELPLRVVSEEMACEPKAYLNELITDGGEDIGPHTASFNTAKYTLLAVDDNPDLIDFLREMLKGEFRQVYTAADGVEALEVIRRYHPDIVVSDVMMPRMNGYELCKQIKEDIDISHIPVILLTARDDEQSQLHGYKIGADGYLTKPFEEDMLLELIRSRLKNREQSKARYLNAGFLPEPEECTISQADESFLLKLNKIIADHLSDSALDVAFLCREIGMSRATLYNKLKALTGVGANDYINKIRLEKAMLLITTTDLNFTEIAERVGFSTSRYFSTTFKQYTGETPTQYKERNKLQKT